MPPARTQQNPGDRCPHATPTRTNGLCCGQDLSRGGRHMSLIQRIERAQQENAQQANGADATAPEKPAASTDVDVAVPTDTPASTNGRGPSLPVVEAVAADAVPVMAPAGNGLRARGGEGNGLRPTRAPVREELIHEVRLRMQTEIVGAFKALLEAKDGDVRAQIEPLVDRAIA